MSKVNQLKNKARREEQRENWSKAIELYTQALDASRKEGEAFADLSLYNRIGDIYLRIGQKNTAVRYYEQAIERYAEQDLHTSAIALCNKVLRIHPERSTIFLQLGRLHLATNLIADARAHYHKYAEAMRERGSSDSALEALEELIDDTGDPQTITLWVTWLAEMSDEDTALARVEELRSSLIAHGVGPDTVIKQIRTGEVEHVEAGPQADAEPDPLADAFLSTPDPFESPALSETGTEDEESESAEDVSAELDEILAAEPVVEGHVEDIQPIEGLTGLDELFGNLAEPRDAAAVPPDVASDVDLADVSAADEVEVPEPTRLELGSVQWNDEAEELLAELNQPLEDAWAEYETETSPSLANSERPLPHAPERDVESTAPPTSLETHLDVALEGMERADRVEGGDLTTSRAMPDSAEPMEPGPAYAGSESREIEDVETRDEPEPAAGLAAAADREGMELSSTDAEIDELLEMSFEHGEFDAPVEWGDASASFGAEPSMTDDEHASPESAEPPESQLSRAEPVVHETVEADRVETEAGVVDHAGFDALDFSTVANAEDGEENGHASPDWASEALEALEAAAAEAEAAVPVEVAAADIEVVAIADESPVMSVEPTDVLIDDFAAEPEDEAIVEAAGFAMVAESEPVDIEIVAVDDEAPSFEAELAEPIAEIELTPVGDDEPVLEIAEGAASESLMAEEVAFPEETEVLAGVEVTLTEDDAPASELEPAAIVEEIESVTAPFEPIVELVPVPDLEPTMNLEPDTLVEEVPVSEELLDAVGAELPDAEELEITVEPTAGPDPAGDVQVTVPDTVPLADLEAETLVLEVPGSAEPPAPTEDEIAVVAQDATSAQTATPGLEAAGEPAEESAVTPEPLDDMSAPLAEPRLKVSEDPEDAFRDWVSSASMGVLKRALPELENRAESDKALLVISRLAHLEDNEVEFKTRLVDTLEKLGRTVAAAEACMPVGAVLETLQREAEARAIYQRALRMKPGYDEARVAIELLGDVQEAAGTTGEEGIEVRPTPYMPDHVGSSDTSGVLDSPPPTNGAPSNGHGNGNGNGYDSPRPYSGVAGGDEASDDFEKLLTEFRAELHHRPGEGGASSRTELGASLKEMGRLDDAIRELQAAVREPSAPPMAYELLGEAFLEKGQGRIAVRLLEKALGTLGHGDRELMGILYQLGHAYEATSENNKALMCYERIFSVDIDYRDIQDRIMACSA